MAKPLGGPFVSLAFLLLWSNNLKNTPTYFSLGLEERDLPALESCLVVGAWSLTSPMVPNFPKLLTCDPVGDIVHLNSNRKYLMGSSHKQLIVVFNHYIDSVPGNVNRESGSMGLCFGVCFDLLIYILRWPVCLVFISKAKLQPWKALWDHLIPFLHLPVEGTNSPNTQGFWPLSWAGLCGSYYRESRSCKNLSVLSVIGVG